MGLFDFFKKKDAAFYLNRARTELAAHRWASARDDLDEGLALQNVSADMRAQLEAAKVEAYRGLCEINIADAEHSIEAKEFARAHDAVETARAHAPDEALRARVTDLAARLKEAKANANRPMEVLQPVSMKDLEDDGGPDTYNAEFEAYLAGLAPDVAEVYSALGSAFADAYVAMNGGDPRPMLELLPKMRPSSEARQALLAFEHARAALMVQRPDRALVMLDVAASIRGSEPIFLSGHPSIPYLRFECLAMMNRLDEGIDALKEGLRATPDQQELKLTLASALLGARRLDEAEPLLTETLSCNKGDPQVHVMRAQLLVLRGEKEAAVDALEGGIKSCGCGPSSLPHPMLARSLADLLLDQKQNPERVETLLNQIFRAQQGEGEWIDHFLRARYLKWQGDEDLARVSLKKALDGMDDPRDPRRRQMEALFAS